MPTNTMVPPEPPAGNAPSLIQVLKASWKEMIKTGIPGNAMNKVVNDDFGEYDQYDD